MNKIATLTIHFKNQLLPHELPCFRGAVISKVPQSLVLFHNHQDDGFRYHYPLIQYKCINKKAAIVCIGEGTEAISHFFSTDNLQMRIGNREDMFEVEKIVENQWDIDIDTGHLFPYSIHNWLPFNQENLKQYQRLEGLVEQLEFLQHILVGNMLSICTGLNIHIDKEIECHIQSISPPIFCSFKRVKMVGFNLDFTSNLFLPNFLGLGKGVSLGYGTFYHSDY